MSYKNLGTVVMYHGQAAQYFCALFFDEAMAFAVHGFEAVIDPARQDEYLLVAHAGVGGGSEKYVSRKRFTDEEIAYKNMMRGQLLNKD